MSFINSEVQCAFFEIICKRRIKRVMYGVTLYHLEMLFDRCLNIILCHHPHIWSYGTGNLLVAPNIPEIITKSAERATEWRKASNCCSYSYELVRIFFFKIKEYA